MSLLLSIVAVAFDGDPLRFSGRSRVLLLDVGVGGSTGARVEFWKLAILELK